MSECRRGRGQHRTVGVATLAHMDVAGLAAATTVKQKQTYFD